ncbi:hypothetical protein HD553DRAFT_323446 [Filobasidium floriforme]|uniref:uncharacterized protein n=1 Tax=Filobasidium floriforme TaxID=5210 RepID=UPI001E8CDB0F|nr:uncharacterized protein HD553DRAFT_323446 [Filobasidium floriforme]KAH8086510.1 hypothetical protein HD553DRAFT_323446 [Filobasidium floriforme]
MDEGFINDEVDYSVEDDSYTDDQLPTNYDRVSAQVQQETPSSWGDDIPDTVKAMPAPTIVTGTPRVSGAAQKETRAEQSTTKPNEAARVARTRTTEEILKCGRCGTNAHGQGRGCPWLEEVLRSGALTRVGTDDNYDLIRLDLAEPLSLNRYISNHKGAPIKSTKEAFELSCRSYSMNSVKAIPKWYRFEGQIPSLLGRMRTTIDSRAGVPLRARTPTRNRYSGGYARTYAGVHYLQDRRQLHPYRFNWEGLLVEPWFDCGVDPSGTALATEDIAGKKRTTCGDRNLSAPTVAYFLHPRFALDYLDLAAVGHGGLLDGSRRWIRRFHRTTGDGIHVYRSRHTGRGEAEDARPGV